MLWIKHRPAQLILLAFVGLGIIYSIITPPFEAGDESRHYAVVKYMADTGRLPVQDPAQVGEALIHWEHEGNQPPLYYAAAALLTSWIKTGSWSEVYWYNPHTTIGNPLRPDNKNITIHPPAEGWPWRGHILAVHLIRLFSLALATVTVATSYHIARHMFNGNRPLATAAMALTAFNPMFIFISASVNNDNLVIMLVTLTLWQLLRLSDTAQPSRGQIIRLGLLIGLGALSKLYALGLLPLAGLLLLWRATRSHADWAMVGRTVAQWGLLLGGVVLLIAGWFYLRNALLYHGDWLALQSMRETAGTRQRALTPAILWAEFEGLRIAYWGLFGGVNILAHPWVYRLLDGLSFIALCGLLGYLPRLRHPDPILRRPALLLLLGWLLIMVAGFIIWNLTQPATQGRLFYPAISAISALTIHGLTWWLDIPRLKHGLLLLISLSLFSFAMLTPWLYLRPAYASPPRLTEADLPPDMTPLDYRYDDETIRLRGYRLPTETIRPAERLPITLYWELLRPTELNYSVFIHLLGRNRAVVGQLDSYPSGGKWPTTLLQPGDIVAGSYEVLIQPEAEFNHAPTQLHVAAGVYDYHEPGRPGKPVVNAAGQPIEPLIARRKLVPWQWPTVQPMPQPINLFEQATLLTYQLDVDAAVLTLTWRAEQPLTTDYTVFIQAWDTASGTQVAGFDGPPVGGNYPTSLWAPGEIIRDRHPLALEELPPGRYELRLGLYNPHTGERLPAFTPAGPLPNYAFHTEPFTLP